MPCRIVSHQRRPILYPDIHHTSRNNNSTKFVESYQILASRVSPVVRLFHSKCTYTFANNLKGHPLSILLRAFGVNT